MSEYRRPRELEEALELLARRPGWRIVAGATDLYPASIGKPLSDPLLDITGIAGLRGIERSDGGWRIGACTPWADIRDHGRLPPMFDGLRAAACEIGGRQIQSRATIGGNLCNASPAADGTPNLLALDAEVELASLAGTRRLPVSAFVLGNRRTARRTDELVTAIYLPERPGTVRSGFVKLGSRRYLVISIVACACRVDLDAAGGIREAAVAVGACSPVPVRLRGLEERLCGLRPGEDPAGLVDPSVLSDLSPIDDVRGTASYRMRSAEVLLRRLLCGVLSEGEQAA